MMTPRRVHSKWHVSFCKWIAIPLLTLTSPIAFGQRGLGAEPINDAVRAIQTVGEEGKGFDLAIPAAEHLQRLPSSMIPRILDGASGVNPIAENWIRGIVFGIAKNSEQPDLAMLQAYILDQSNNPIGRGLAMELIRQQDPDIAKTMIDDCLNDPSLALREMAVEQSIEAAAAMEKNDPAEAIARYRMTLDAARHPTQLSRVVEALEKLDQSVTTASAFALITKWHGVAPFDNGRGIGYDAVYPPEAAFIATANVDLGASYDGKSSDIRWQNVEGSGKEGIVDLAAAFNKEKGAVAYLYTEFESSKDQPAQARLGCINANKVWVNGKEVTANEVYHTGSMLDQYIGPCELHKGTNRILLKICQNEQEESWAQNWEFQFRLTDPTGKGLKSGQ